MLNCLLAATVTCCHEDLLTLWKAEKFCLQISFHVNAIKFARKLKPDILGLAWHIEA